MCLCVRQILGNLRILVAPTSYWQTSNYTRIKNNNRLLLKPFGYKVMTIFITHGYCFQTWEDSWEHLDTLKHKYSCIMTIASKALHKSKQNLGSGCYNIEHWLQEFSITFKLRLFQIFKSCAVHVTRTSAVLRTCLSALGSLYRTFHKTNWGSFFLLWDKTETEM